MKEKISKMSTGRIILLTIILLIIVGAIFTQVTRLTYAAKGQVSPWDQAYLDLVKKNNE